MRRNKEIIDFLFDFSGLDFTESDQIERDRLVEETTLDFDKAIFLIKADKVELLLNRLRVMAEKK